MVIAEPETGKMIEEKIAEIDAISHMIPAAIIILRLPDVSVAYMSKTALALLGQRWEDIKDMPGDEYFRRFFNVEEAREYAPKIFKLLEDNSNDTISFFQQVRTNPEREWDWYMTSVRILLRDSQNKPVLCINIAQKVDPDNVFTTKAVKLIEENQFIRKNFQEFARLGKREISVLRLLALGKSAGEVAKALGISVATAETHRKNIRRKLNITNSYELTQFAQAFNLV